MRARAQSPFCYSLQAPSGPPSPNTVKFSHTIIDQIFYRTYEICLSKPQSLSGATIGNLSPKIDQSILRVFNALSN